MSNLYPLKPVVCNNAELAALYNQDQTSIFQTSSCLTAEDVVDMINNGAQLDTLVLVNGQGEELIYHIGECVNWDEEKLPKIVRVNVPEHSEMAINEIHNAIVKASGQSVWAG